MVSCEELEKTTDIGKGEEMKESQDQTEYDDRWAPLSCRLYIVRGGGDRRGKTPRTPPPRSRWWPVTSDHRLVKDRG